MANNGQFFNPEHFLVSYLNISDKTLGIFEFGKDYTRNLYDLVLIVFYICNKTAENTCELYDEEKEQNKILNTYGLIFNYSGQKVDHQNAESPIKEEYGKLLNILKKKE